MLMIVASILCSACFLALAESQDEKEAKQAAAEEAAEKLLPEDQQFGKSYSGTFSLTNSDLQKSPIVGSFGVDKGGLYLVKLSDPSLLKRISIYDGKKCMLTGKLRNDSKYLVVTALIAF